MALPRLLANSACLPPSPCYAAAMSDTAFHMREDPWRIFRIMSEFVDSFLTLSQAGPP